MTDKAEDAPDENWPELTAQDKQKIVAFMRSDVDVASDPIELFRCWANDQLFEPDEMRPELRPAVRRAILELARDHV